tara:strand:- start:19912 stop:20052 length:141 start_codon:yes stop_codon:yes gene_type:complete
MSDKEININSEVDQNGNLVGFFAILLQIDRRLNPQNYKENKDNQDD